MDSRHLGHIAGDQSGRLQTSSHTIVNNHFGGADSNTGTTSDADIGADPNTNLDANPQTDLDANPNTDATAPARSAGDGSRGS